MQLLLAVLLVFHAPAQPPPFQHTSTHRPTPQNALSSLWELVGAAIACWAAGLPRTQHSPLHPPQPPSTPTRPPPGTPLYCKTSVMCLSIVAAGADWWEARGESAVPLLPPDSVLDAVLRDLLSPPRHTSLHTGSNNSSNNQNYGNGSGSGANASRQGSGSSSSSRGLTPGQLVGEQEAIAAKEFEADLQQHGMQQAMQCLMTADGSDGGAGIGSSGSGVVLPRAAPPGSLLCRLACHALVFGNARAVAALWQRFVMQVGGRGFGWPGFL